MKLGMNLIGTFEEWRKWRPFINQALQVEPLWSGDWANRVYPQWLEPGVTYRAAVSAGSLVGPHEVQCNVPYRLFGTRLTSGNVHEFLPQNVWLEISPTQRVHTRDVRLSIIPIHLIDADRSTYWQHFDSFVKPFSACLRVMNATGPFGSAPTASRTLDFGHSVRGRPTEEEQTFDREVGVQPWALAVPGFQAYWLNMPLKIAAQPNEAIAWVAARMAAVPPTAQIYISVSNELWNGVFPQARYLFDWAVRTGIHEDPYIGRCLLALRLTSQLKTLLAPIGDKVKVVFEWQNAAGGRWAFENNPWNAGRPVCEDAQILIKHIGVIAVAPYFARSVRVKEELMNHVTESMADLLAWKNLCDRLGVKLWCYEGGHELPLDVDPAIHRTPEMAASCVEYLNRVNDILDDDAIFCWYGLNEPHWGVCETHDDMTHPRFQALKHWVEAR